MDEGEVGSWLETSVLKKIQLALSGAGARIFRNQVGTYKLAIGGYVTSGLGVGSSDLVGWSTVVVSPEMVGRKVAVFTAIEVKTFSSKTKKRRLEEQKNFIRVVKEAGGIAGFARTEEEAVTLLQAYSPPASKE